VVRRKLSFSRAVCCQHEFLTSEIMTSLTKIMREQEDERLAWKLYTQELQFWAAQKNEEKKEKEQCYSENISDIQEPSCPSVPSQDVDLNKEVVRRLVLEEDEELARELQEAENQRVRHVHPKYFSALEQVLGEFLSLLRHNKEIETHFSLNILSFPTVSGLFPVYVTERQNVLNLKALSESRDVDDDTDEAYCQCEEDKNIAFVYQRVPEKQNNRSVPRTLHHQSFSTRNIGKKDKVTKKIPHKIASKHIHDIVRRTLPLRGDGYEYAFILGANKSQVFCYHDCTVRHAHISGKVRRSERIERGDFVLVKLRPYQFKHVDVVFKYTPEECLQLFQMGELYTFDIFLSLPSQIIYNIISYLDSFHLTRLKIVCSHWRRRLNELLTSTCPSTHSSSDKTTGELSTKSDINVNSPHSSENKLS